MGESVNQCEHSIVLPLDGRRTESNNVMSSIPPSSPIIPSTSCPNISGFATILCKKVGVGKDGCVDRLEFFPVVYRVQKCLVCMGKRMQTME